MTSYAHFSSKDQPMKLTFRIFASLAVVVTAIACSSSSSTPPPADNAGSCAQLASQCHGVETPIGIECHELGHDGDDSKCGPRRAECLAACPDGAHGDGGHTEPQVDAGDAGNAGDASADAGDPCRGYCDCMKAACSTSFADDAACLAACAAFPAKDFACFAQHCEDAKTAADPAHDCEHASGDVACH
jgi:hypothetical protein